MEITYKAAEGLLLIVPVILAYVYKSKLNIVFAEHLLLFRAVFALSFVIDLALSYFVKRKIAQHNVKAKIRFSHDDYITVVKQKKEQTEKEKPENEKEEKDKQTEERVEKQEKKEKKEEQPEEDEEVEMTVCEYDTKVINTHISKLVTNALVHTALHLIIKTPQPIMMLIFSPIKNIFFFPLYIEYLCGKKMLRPFSRNIMFQIGGVQKNKSNPEEEVAQKKKKKEEENKPAEIKEKEPRLKKEE